MFLETRWRNFHEIENYAGSLLQFIDFSYFCLKSENITEICMRICVQFLLKIFIVAPSMSNKTQQNTKCTPAGSSSVLLQSL
jgi:hypothetical protein